MPASAARLLGLLVILPLSVALSTHAALRWAMAAYGAKWGYLAGFVWPYWGLWCYYVPKLVVGSHGVRQLLRPPRGGAAPWLAALAPAAGVAALGWQRIAGQAWPVLAASAALAAVNGLGEELLWRGLFLRCFPPPRRWAGWVLTGVCFPLWHLAFLAVEPAQTPGGNAGFVAGAAAIGVLWGWAALRSGSLWAPVAGHAALNAASLIAARYFT